MAEIRSAQLDAAVLAIQRFITQTHPRYFSNLTEIADTHDTIVEVLRQTIRKKRRGSFRAHHADLVTNW